MMLAAMNHEDQPFDFLHQREAHYERFFGPMDQDVIHSTDIQPVHIDIYQFAPTADRPYWTLVTGGMSDERQLLPEFDDHRSSRTEILMYVREPQEWMFDDLKVLAEFPFVEDTHLHWWHTVPIGQPIDRARSQLRAYLFLPPYFEDPALSELEIDGDRVDFLWLHPITEAERAFAEARGSQELEKVIRAANLPIVIDESRSSLVRKSLFGGLKLR